jgi:hypothetical protein
MGNEMRGMIHPAGGENTKTNKNKINGYKYYYFTQAHTP